MIFINQLFVNKTSISRFIDVKLRDNQYTGKKIIEIYRWASARAEQEIFF